MPFKVPGGVFAVFAGWGLAALSTHMGYEWFTPAGGSTYSFAPQFAMPTLHYRFLATFADAEFWQCISVVIPMWCVTLVNNLSNIQSASSVGDEYSPRDCLLGCALLDIACCFLGNPFPSCVYIGHPAFKAMGCRVGYLYLNIAPTLFFGCLQGAGLLQQIIPIESGVSFLLWVGLQITASGFEGDHTPEGWKHGPAVALGLLPSIAAWSWQSVETTFSATRSLYCNAMDSAAAAAMPECALELYELMQPASAPMADALSSRGAFQRNVVSLFLSGMFALANGYLLTAIALSSILVHIIDGKFHKASLWLVLMAAFSSLGIIHSKTLDPLQANQLFPAMYLLAAVLLLLCHWAQNRAEQIRELQVQWAAALVQLSERFPTALAPAASFIDTLAARFGLQPNKPPSPSRASTFSSTRGFGGRELRRGSSAGSLKVPASRSRSLLESLGVDWLDEPLSPDRASREGYEQSAGGASADAEESVPGTPATPGAGFQRELRRGASDSEIPIRGLPVGLFPDTKAEPLLHDTQPV